MHNDDNPYDPYTEVAKRILAPRGEGPLINDHRNTRRTGVDNSEYDVCQRASSVTEKSARFLDAVFREVDFAREKFPSSECSLAALTEEVGELAQACMDESADAIFAEAVQVAAMALRVAVEGDPTLVPYRLRNKKLEGQVAVWGTQGLKGLPTVNKDFEHG